MSTNIELSRDTEMLASKVARKRGISLGQVIEEAIADSARKAGLLDEGAKPSKEKIVQALDELSLKFMSLPELDARSFDEIIGYDEFGLPQ